MKMTHSRPKTNYVQTYTEEGTCRCGHHGTVYVRYGRICRECVRTYTRQQRERKAIAEGRNVETVGRIHDDIRSVLSAIRASMPRGITAAGLGFGVHDLLIRLEDAGQAYWNRSDNRWYAFVHAIMAAE
jgi:hypothetical protein